MKEALSSEVPQKKGPVRTYSDSLEKPHSESLPLISEVFKDLANPDTKGNTDCVKSVQPLSV